MPILPKLASLPQTNLPLPASVSHVWRADNVSFVCFGNSKHNIFWSRSQSPGMIMQSPCFSMDWGQRTIVNCRNIFMTQASEAPLPHRIPTQISPSHSDIAAQSSLSFASRVLGFKKINQGHAANAVTEQPRVKNNPFLHGWDCHLAMFCLSSCQQVPQLMKGKWNPSSSKNSIPSLLLITSQDYSGKVTDSKYDAIISLQFISTLFYMPMHPSYCCWSLNSAKNCLFDCAIPYSFLCLKASSHIANFF